MIRRIPQTEIDADLHPLAAHATSVAEDAAAAPAADHTALARALTLLLSEELRLRPEHIQHVLQRELLRVRRAARIVVRVHPDDLALLAAPEDYSHALELAGQLTFSTDTTITRGGCVIDSNLGEVDASLETRLSLALALLRHGGFA